MRLSLEKEGPCRRSEAAMERRGSFYFEPLVLIPKAIGTIPPRRIKHQDFIKMLRRILIDSGLEL